MFAKFNPTWSVLSFEFPTDTNAAKCAGRKFLRELRRYAATFSGAAAINILVRAGRGMAVIMKRPAQLEALLRPILPADAAMSIMPLTDAQVGKRQIVWGERRNFARTE